MNLNVTQKIFIVTLTAGLALIALGAVVLQTFNTVVDSNDRLTRLNEALKNHQTADMMHDAIRGDVISFRLAQATTDQNLAASSRDELAGHAQELEDRLAANQALDLPPSVVQLLAPTRESLSQYLRTGQVMMSSDTMTELERKRVMTAFIHAFDELEDAMGAVSDELVETMRQSQSQVASLVTSFKLTLLGGLAVAAVLLVVISLLVARSVPRPFARIISELRQTSARNAESAEIVARSSTHLADSANHQAASLEQIGASLEEVAGMTSRNTEHAQRAKSLSGSARSGVDAGTDNMAHMVTAMDAIKQASEEIAAILKTIDEIAFQTNILALNAAVEAARAGEAGAGFAVVADEVRALAQRSAKAAREVEGKIADAIQRSDLGVSICSEVNGQLATIAQQVREVDDLMLEIANASHEQAQNTQQVNAAVAQMDSVVQRSAAQAEESSSTATDLSHQAKSLESAVERLGQLVGRSSLMERKNHHAAPASDRPQTHRPAADFVAVG